ncbi:hypothetical protein F7725_024606, partial [Dissostichus mawsoni]
MCTLCTLHCVLCTAAYTVQSTQCRVHSAEYTVQSTHRVHRVHSAEYTVQSTQSTQCRVHSAEYTEYTVQSTQCSSALPPCIYDVFQFLVLVRLNIYCYYSDFVNIRLLMLLLLLLCNCFSACVCFLCEVTDVTAPTLKFTFIC